VFQLARAEYCSACFFFDETVRDLCSGVLDDDPPQDGNRLRDNRIEADLSQRDLARLLNSQMLGTATGDEPESERR